VDHELRPATPADATAIRDVTRAAYAHWVPVIGREPVPMTIDYEQAVRQHDFDLLYRQGELVGLIETMLQDDHIWIENVAVLPACHGQGLGRILLAHAETRALDAGCNESRLLTNAAFESNVALYKKIGYRVDRTEPYKDGGTTVYMSKRLARA
jgi:ribosomal protein S18 acetylase RimI-like enzyme